ncbi:MAG TPA: hypothetical protein VFS49_05010 [Croceibacterium sp.]|nr:hypothetical protein [Croceibacterium sp.]
MTAVALAATPAVARDPVVQGPLCQGPAAGSESSTVPRAVVERDGAISICNTTRPRFERGILEHERAAR